MSNKKVEQSHAPRQTLLQKGEMKSPISVKDLPQFLIEATAALECGRITEATLLINNNDEAVESVQRMDKKKPLGIFASYMLAVVLHKIGRLSQAEELCMDILETGLPFPFVYNVLGQICREDKRISEAIGYFEKAIEQHPDNTNILSSFADVLTDSGRSKQEVAVAVQKARVEGFFAQNGKLIREQKPEQRYQTIVNILQQFRLSGYMVNTNRIAAFFNPEEAKWLEKVKEYKCEPPKEAAGRISGDPIATGTRREQMRVNYFDMGLCDGEEMGWMVDSILPSLGIENYCAYGFEPCQAFYDKLKSKFGHHDKVVLVKKAISNKNGVAKLYYSRESKEGHSLFDTKHNVAKDEFEIVESILFSDWLREEVPDFAESFNILRFNIEGAEWHLIDDLAKNDLIENIDIFCGHGDDVKKIGEYKDKVNEYYETLEKYNIKILLFCSIYPTTQKALKEMIQGKLTLKKIGLGV